MTCYPDLSGALSVLPVTTPALYRFGCSTAPGRRGRQRECTQRVVEGGCAARGSTDSDVLGVSLTGRWRPRRPCPPFMSRPARQGGRVSGPSATLRVQFLSVPPCGECFQPFRSGSQPGSGQTHPAAAAARPLSTSGISVHLVEQPCIGDSECDSEQSAVVGMTPASARD